MAITVAFAHQNIINHKIKKGNARQQALIPAVVSPAYENYRTRLDAATAIADESRFLDEATLAFSEYKDIIDALEIKKAFSAQTKFHSTAHEEFWALMLQFLMRREDISVSPTLELYIGPGNTLQNITFSPRCFNNLLLGPTEDDPFFLTRLKDRDVVLGVKLELTIKVNGVSARFPKRTREHGASESVRTQKIDQQSILVPIVTIECKQYIDKTMLDNAMAAADHLKSTNPACLDLISIELNKLSDLNIGSSGIDNLYLLRNQHLKQATFRTGEGPTDTPDIRRRNSINPKVVSLLYRRIKKHLTIPYWRASMEEFIREGFVLG